MIHNPLPSDRGAIVRTLRSNAARVVTNQRVSAAFDRIEVVTQLAPTAQKEGPGQCFIGAEQFDLLCDGRKIAGAAQRRNRLGLLIQGSVQAMPRGAERVDWETEMISLLTRHAPFILPPDLKSRAEILASSKYAADEYNRRR